MINTRLTIAGTDYTDQLNIQVDTSNSDYTSSSKFTIMFDNPAGRHSTDFNVGDEVIIYADKDTDPATTKLFTGIVERVNFKGTGNKQILNLTGRDYTQRLMDITIEPVVYTNSEVSTIITNILTNAGITDITTNNVDTTSTTLQRIAFNQIPIYNAFAELAELSGFYFYIDADKDLNFKQKKNVSSGITLNNTNILAQRLNTTREGMANDVWVYGDRQLAGYNELLTTDGGSVFTLISKPHNTFVEYLGSPQRGAVYQMATVPSSGTNYLINYFDSQIIFVSGTDIGYDSIPINTGSILVTYDREIPIVKHGVERDSILAYGRKNKIINDKSIRDPQTATDILKKQLENADPFKGSEAELKGWFSLIPGQTVNVTMTDFNLSETNLPILSVNYVFDRNTIFSENVMKVKFNKKIINLTDELSLMKRRIDAIEAGDRQDTDVITRLEQATGSLLVVGSKWYVKTNITTGSYLRCAVQGFGTDLTGTLASGTLQRGCAGSHTGSVQAFLDFSIQVEGGYY